MTEPAETSELLAFVQTADQKSLSRAARELGVPRATISRRLARLEEHLGVRLLRRTTRSLALTDAGEAFYGHAKLALEAVGQAEASVQITDNEARGALRVSVPPMGNSSFHQFLLDFAAAHPKVELQVDASSHFVDLQKGGYHVALRAGTTLEPGLVARRLGKAPVLLVASPAYLEARGVPQRPADLSQHECLLSFSRGELPQTHWPLGTKGKIAVKGSFATNDLTLLKAAVVAGRGIAFLPIQVLVDELERGTLVPVLQGVVGADSWFSAVYAEREFMPAAVRAFIDEVARWATANMFQAVLARCAALGAGKTVP